MGGGGAVINIELHQIVVKDYQDNAFPIPSMAIFLPVPQKQEKKLTGVGLDMELGKKKNQLLID